MLIKADDVAALVRCPRCGSAVQGGQESWRCESRECLYATVGFPVVQGQPVLVDFEDSVFERAAYQNGRGSVLKRDDTRKAISTRVRSFTMGKNAASARACEKVIGLAKQVTPEPLVLIVGGGAIGYGTEPFYSDAAVRVVGTDVYASSNTCLIADGHHLPFRDGSFDAVWIQAVLEHVLNPQQVVDEIHRVLCPAGLVYADTPFMQQVHEGAYDFMRFTHSGHRWLLRRFGEIESGASGGAGKSLLWSIRYFVRALGAGKIIVQLTLLPLFWLRLLEHFMQRRANLDSASGTYFLGRRSDVTLTTREMVAYYEQNA
jgi:SAM-dependent methyltransferase